MSTKICQAVSMLYYPYLTLFSGSQGFCYGSRITNIHPVVTVIISRHGKRISYPLRQLPGNKRCITDIYPAILIGISPKYIASYIVRLHIHLTGEIFTVNIGNNKSTSAF